MPDKLSGENRYPRLAQDVKRTATKPEPKNGLWGRITTYNHEMD